MTKQAKSHSVALAGVLSALALVIMLLGDVIPLAEIVAPGVASLVLIPLAVEHGAKWQGLAYLAVAILSLLLLPQKEVAFLFAFVLGYYPLLKKKLEAAIRSRALQWGLKMLWLAVAVALCYGLLWLLFPVQFGEGAEAGGLAVLVSTLAISAFTFVLYDRLAATLELVYCRAWRKHLWHILH